MPADGIHLIVCKMAPSTCTRGVMLISQAKSAAMTNDERIVCAGFPTESLANGVASNRAKPKGAAVISASSMMS